MRRARNYAGQSYPAHNRQFSRQWQEPPRCSSFKPIGGAAAKFTDDIAARAVAHWLRQADQFQGEDRRVCLQTADYIVRVAGLRWADFAPRAAA